MKKKKKTMKNEQQKFKIRKFIIRFKIHSLTRQNKKIKKKN